MSRDVIKGAGPLSVFSEHGAVVAFYAALALALSWPLAREFTTVLTGSGLDALSHLWGIWHTAQALLGREPLLSTTLLYYPAGISLLLNSAGPLPGLLAFPFWPLGPVAAYNGGLLVGLTLTGYGMYLLARDVGCSRVAALLAGTIFIGAPAHLVGLRGHLAKVFLGLMPLALLALRRALDLRASVGWSAAFGLTTLLLVLHSPFQFVQVALAAPLVVIAALWSGRDRRAVAMRATWAAVGVLAFAGPLLAFIAREAANPAMLVDRSLESASHTPDIVQLVLPPSFGLVGGQWSTATLASWNISPEIETEVAIPWTALALSLAALVGRGRGGGIWMGLALVGAVLSLGPTLHAFGRDTLITLPYAWITALPGLGFLRTPARFMQLAFVGIAVAAAIGLTRVAPRAGRAQVAGWVAIALILVEVWPMPWPGQTLPAAPPLYQQLASDGETYGILDLPIRPLPDASPVDYSARYQALQMTHRKGIAGGYISRTYQNHPVSRCIFASERVLLDVRVNGRPSRCEPAAIYQLASQGYRYLVWHLPSAERGDNLPGSWAAQDAEAFVAAAFAGQAPTVADASIRAWRLPRGEQALPREPVVELTTGWYPAEPQWRWAQSPAALTVTSPTAIAAQLVVSVALLHGLNTPVGLGQEGVLIVTSGSDTISLAVKPGETVRVPLRLVRGVTDVTLTLGAGNFQPTDYGQEDARTLSFAITAIDLITGDVTSLVRAP